MQFLDKTHLTCLNDKTNSPVPFSLPPWTYVLVYLIKRITRQNWENSSRRGGLGTGNMLKQPLHSANIHCARKWYWSDFFLRWRKNMGPKMGPKSTFGINKRLTAYCPARCLSKLISVMCWLTVLELVSGKHKHKQGRPSASLSWLSDQFAHLMTDWLVSWLTDDSQPL